MNNRKYCEINQMRTEHKASVLPALQVWLPGMRLGASSPFSIPRAGTLDVLGREPGLQVGEAPAAWRGARGTSVTVGQQ